MPPADPTTDLPRIETALHRIGEDLSQRSAGLSPTVFNSRWWTNTLLDWSMKDEDFKVRLFRFIDVLPSLRSHDEVTRLIDEYFGNAQTLGKPIQWGLRSLGATRLGSWLSATSLRRQIHQMANIFIAGATVQDAAPVFAGLWKDGRGFSMDLLGEATVSEVEADRYRDRYLEGLAYLSAVSRTWPASPILEQDHLGPIPRLQLSVKLSALYSQLDPLDPDGSFRGVAARLRPILDQGKLLPAGITFDMEQAELKDLTLLIFQRLLQEEAYRDYPHAGIAIQAYHKESAADLNRLIAWARGRHAPITIRLVKGAYWDSDTIRYRQRGWPVPVLESKAETDANYEALSRVLVQHAAVIRPVFGTHNLRSLSHAEAAAQVAGLPPHAYEFQMIYGMAEPLQSAVAQSGRRVRIYTPVGELLPGMAYLVRRLLENTSNESFLRREYAEAEPLERLLSVPEGSGNMRSAATVRSGSESNGFGPEEPFQNEPHTDFSHASARSAMAQALTHVRGRLGSTFSIEAQPSRTGTDVVSVNPSNPTEVVGRVRGAAPSDVVAAIAKASEAQRPWGRMPAAERVKVLVKAAAAMRARRFELMAWEVFEVGKPWRDADADVAEAIDFLEFYARAMRRLAHPRQLGTFPGEHNELVYSPRGLVAAISPWNFPLAIPTGMVSAALAAGNAVLFKPSERSPVMGYWLTQLLQEAGLPEGVLQFLPGDPEIGRLLVSDPGVHLIAFTGSKEVGLQILAESAKVQKGQHHIKRVIAEMGGKNAIIIDESADLDEAVAGVVASFTGYQGQKCSACSRAIVVDAVHDVFLQRLSEAVQSLSLGPPEDPANRVGPVIDQRALAKVREYIEIGKREGRLVLEGEVRGPGYFVGPAVFSGILPQHRLAQEEIFGPVLAVMRAKDFDDALRLANSTQYGLTGGLYSRSPGNIERAQREFDVGNLYINRSITGALVARQPFGGHRLSGLGTKAGGEDYLAQFMVPRVISENTIRRGFAPST